MGAAHPDEHTVIVRGYKRALSELKDYIEELEARKPTAKALTE